MREEIKIPLIPIYGIAETSFPLAANQDPEKKSNVTFSYGAAAADGHLTGLTTGMLRRRVA